MKIIPPAALNLSHSRIIGRNETPSLQNTNTLQAILCIMTVLAILMTIGRFRIHWVKNKTFGWDDYLNAVALSFLLIFTIIWQIVIPIQYEAFLYSSGLIERPSEHYNVALVLKLGVVNIFMFFCITYSVKGSLLVLYWKIFNVSTKFRVAWWSVAVYTILSFLISVLSIFWNCGSPTNFLDPGKISICC